MAFPDIIVLQAWKRSGGKCECDRKIHNDHFNRIGKCNRALIYKSRGKFGAGAWEAHHVHSGAGDTLENCQILCWDCHQQTVM